LTFNIDCLLVFQGVYFEKGMGLLIPGLTSDVLAEIHDFSPTGIERLLSLGSWAAGLFVYTMLLRVAIPILNGDFHMGDDGVTPVIADDRFFVRRANKLT